MFVNLMVFIVLVIFFIFVFLLIIIFDVSEEELEFVENVLFYVVFYEFGYGLIWEFDLFVLGNEEIVVDVFVICFIFKVDLDWVIYVILVCVELFMMEVDEVFCVEWFVWGEYVNDVRCVY